MVLDTNIANQIRYFNITWLSETDGPGKRLVLFLQGCNLNCIWCHSPHSIPNESPLLVFNERCIECKQCESTCKKGVHTFSFNKHLINRLNCIKCGDCILSCPVSSLNNNGGALFLPTVKTSVDSLFFKIKPHLELIKNIGGITISGGEPLLQCKSVAELAKRCKEINVHTALETSGIVSLQNVKEVLPFIDTWLLGFRLTNGYQVDILPQFETTTRQLLDLLTNNSKEIIVRIPIIPDYTSSQQYLLRVKEIMNEFGIRKIEILPYNSESLHYYNAIGIKPRIEIDKKNADSAFENANIFFQSNN